MIVYADTPICEWWLKKLNVNCIKKVLDDSIGLALFQLPYPLSNDEKFLEKLNITAKQCWQVVVLVSELHKETVKFITLHQHPKIKYFICGVIPHSESYHLMDWFSTTLFFYKNNIEVLGKLVPYEIKPKTFDILLGRQKPHRSVVYNYIKQNQLDNKVIMTYLQGKDGGLLSQQTEIGYIWEDDIELLEGEYRWTVTPVRYHGQNMSLSQIIPIKIYNQTAYTIVAETNYDNHYSFFTEKIVKPILAERLFLVFSGQNYLKNLRTFGFRTFDGIIDETYDSISDHNDRFNAIIRQMDFLLSQPQELILEKIRPITEHNRRIMLSTDWQGQFLKELQDVLLVQPKQNLLGS